MSAPLRKTSWGLRGRALLVFGSLGALSLLCSVLLFREYRKANEELDRVIHTHEVIAESEAFLGYLSDAETGQRGYLLTERAEYLEPYESGVLLTRESYAALVMLTSDNPEQQDRLTRVGQLMDEKLAELARTIELLNSGDREAALELVNTDLGRRSMRAVRRLLDDFSEEEQRLLALRSQSHASEQFHLVGWIIAQAVFLLAALLYVAINTQRYILKPIRLLTRSARELSQRDHDEAGRGGVRLASLTDDFLDEFATLSAAFVEMDRVIEERERRLQSYASDLEDEIEARERAETSLLQSQKLEAVGQLAGGIAHDFNNLLSVIAGYGELLKADLDPEDEELQESAAGILTAAGRAASLTQRLLAFSRRQALSPRVIDVSMVLESIRPLVERLMPEHIEMSFAHDEDLWRTFVDVAQLENVIMNLAINARDAMPNGGALVVTARNRTRGAVDDGGLGPGDYVELVVADSGEGIPPENLERVLEPYFTTKAVGKGSGLGLSMAFGFARQSQGGLTLRSEVGVGTEVSILLPRSQGEIANADTAFGAEARAAGAGEQVLVVEDGEMLLELISRQLKSLGYRVLTARSGPEALELFAGNAGVSVLLTDLVLPGGMTGRQLAERLRRVDDRLRVVFMSGYSEEAVGSSTAVEVGRNLLKKPFTLAELSEHLSPLG